METLYLSGRMRGLPQYGAPVFDAAAKDLRAHWFHVRNPAEMDRQRGIDLDKPVTDDIVYGLMMDDISLIMSADIDGIVLLPNWIHSEGAKVERRVAEAVGKKVYHYVEDHDARAVRCHVKTDDCLEMSWEQEEPAAYPPAQEFTNLAKGSAAITSALLASKGEIRVTDPTTGGMKGQKLARFDLLPVGPLVEVAELYGAGALKYEDRNWERGYLWSLSFGAMQRHAWKFWHGEDVDPETRKHHMASVAFHAMALMEFGTTHPEKDDRVEAA